MQKHRDVLQQASRLAVAVALCIAAMLAVYALTGHFTNAVLLGALIGFVMAMGNFLSLSITVSNAMNRAANGGSPQKAQLEIQTSSVVRPVILVIISEHIGHQVVTSKIVGRDLLKDPAVSRRAVCPAGGHPAAALCADLHQAHRLFPPESPGGTKDKGR